MDHYSPGAHKLGEEPENVLTRWFALHRRLDPSAAMLFSSLTTDMFVEQQLIGLTSAAEGYHRARHDVKPLEDQRHEELVARMLAQCESPAERSVYKDRLGHANSLSQRKRLRSLFERAATVLPELGDDLSQHLAELADTRDYYVHQDQRGKRVLGGLELYDAVVRLGVVLQANLLLDLDIPRDLAAVALRRSYQGDPVIATG